MLDYHFDLPVRLCTGEGCVRREGRAMKALGDRCLLVTGRSGARKSGALDDVVAVLEEEAPYLKDAPLPADCMSVLRKIPFVHRLLAIPKLP